AGERAYGVVARPSPVFSGNDPSVRTPATLELAASWIDFARGAGLFVEASDVSVERTLISDIGRDALGRGAGIDARAHLAGYIPGTLRLSQTVIMRTHDAGVRLWNADAEILDSVITDVGNDEPNICLGNGIRARYDLPRDIGLGTRLTLQRSLIANSAEA